MKSVLFWFFFLNIILLFFTLVTGPGGTIKHSVRWRGGGGGGEKKRQSFFARVTHHEPTVNNRPLYDEPNYDIIQIA